MCGLGLYFLSTLFCDLYVAKIVYLLPSSFDDPPACWCTISKYDSVT